MIDPTGMNRGVNKQSVGPAGSDAIDCHLAAMSRAVIHDPKALGGFIRFTAHHLSNEAIGGSDAAFLFVVPEELSPMDIQAAK